MPTHLEPWVPDSAHVGFVGLDTATDREVWAYAGEHGYPLVLKGESAVATAVDRVLCKDEAELRAAHEAFFPRLMGRDAALA